MDNLRSILQDMTYQGSRDTLTELIRLANIKPAPKKKADAVEALYRFYSSKDAAAGLYARLNAYEKALLTCIVQSKFRPLEDELRQIAKAYNHKESYDSFYGSGYRARFFPKDSKLYAFFIRNTISPCFKTYLEGVIPPYVRVFHPCTIDDIEPYASIIGREQRYKDFDMLLKFINNNKVAATKAGGFMNKNALLKFHQIAGYTDICNTETGGLTDIRNAGETMISFGMVQLLRCADVIDIIKDKFTLSNNASLFAGLSVSEKAKFLFSEYIRHGNAIIDECARISAAKLQFSKSVYNLSGPRKAIISYLAECPVNEWVDFSQFSNELYKANNALFEVAGSPMIRDDYYNQYYNYASWDDFEVCAISVMLIEYLATLGAVDILAEESSHSDYDDFSAYETSYFRVTDLGAYLFGITDTYQEKQLYATSDDETGFIVLSNFDVVIQNGKDRMRHELFFDRFAEKTVSDTDVSVYKLNFKGMVKALDIGLSVREVSQYCETFATAAIPDNVMVAFSEWEAQSGKIRIRTMTVIETDDPYLLEEIKNYKGMSALADGGITTVLPLTPNSEKKAKRLIEKNKRFCGLGH